MIIPTILFLSALLLYVPLQSISIYAGDSGELVSAAYTWGIAHPPGYPLYTFLGALLSHTLSIQTVAWRVGLLSSVPTAVSCVFLYLVLRRLSVRTSICVISSSLFALSYPVWLYAIVPEVFGLYTMFLLSLLYFSILYIQKKHTKILYCIGFLASLSATHHHAIIFFLLPLFWVLRKEILKTFQRRIVFFWLFVLLGILFYAYAPIVSLQHPPFDWEHPASIEGFIRLVTRAQYGTFRASYGTGNSFLFRILNVMALFQYMLADFGIPLLCIGVVGIGVLWMYRNALRTILLVPFFLYVFYFFYAGFPTIGDFALGTIERFMIAPYVFLVLCIALGYEKIISFIESIWKTKNTVFPIWSISFLLILLFLLIPIKHIRSQYGHMIYISVDRTVERLGMDILRILPQDAMFSMSSDTGGFSTYYAYYVLGYRPDVKHIAYAFVSRPYYQTYIRKTYPDIIFPTQQLSSMDYLKEFLRVNGEKRPVFDEISQVYQPGYWVPYGMLVKYYKQTTDLPTKEEGISQNRIFWDTVYNPLSGALSNYRHMLLSDVARYYAGKRLVFGEYASLYDENELAYFQYKQALGYDPTYVKSYASLLELEVSLKYCDNARTSVEKLLQYVPSYEEYRDVIDAYIRTCPQQFSKQYPIFRDYIKTIEKTQTPLE